MSIQEFKKHIQYLFKANTKNTIESRKDIGFLANRKEWATEPAVYDKHTLRIAGHPVMEDWELGYMQDLAKVATSRGGKILELGYGLGLSAAAIQSHNIESHYVIECNTDVIKKAFENSRSAIEKNRFHILSGFWQDVTPLIMDETFDGILFDTYPLTEEEIHKNHFWFFKEAHRLLKPGGILTYYSDESREFSQQHILKLTEAGFKKENIKFETCNVNPPKDCEYWQEKTIIIPIIKK